jgi:hypothetical protein
MRESAGVKAAAVAKATAGQGGHVLETRQDGMSCSLIQRVRDFT